jgi:ribosomal protein S18 acetylase RimI-like enzyme
MLSVRIAAIDLAEPGPLAAAHALQRAAYAVEASLIGNCAIPGLSESVGALGQSREGFFGAWTSGAGDGAVDAGEGVLVGLVAIEREPGRAEWPAGVTRISRLAVDPAWHRRGVGRALILDVIDRTGGVVVVSTGAANTPARRLYEGVGMLWLRDFFTPDGGTGLVEYVLRR